MKYNRIEQNLCGIVMENNNGLKPHKLVMERRRKLSLTGVNDVVSFDLKHVLLETNMGMLSIKGSELKVAKVNLDSGELNVDGVIDSLEYSDVKDYSRKSKSMLKRLFR